MTYFAENMGNFAAQFNCIRILQIQFYNNSAMGRLGTWLIAKYQFSRFETR